MAPCRGPSATVGRGEDNPEAVSPACFFTAGGKDHGKNQVYKACSAARRSDGVEAGCAGPTFPPRIMDQVDRKISFSDLSKDPGRYKGKWVMLAGVIVRSSTEKDGSTYIEVVQKPADSRGRPLRTDETGGRFIAVSKQFLDPAVYRSGRVITVVGDVIGDTVKPLGETAYRYPLLEVQAMRLWEPSYGPRYSIGVGVFHRF